MKARWEDVDSVFSFAIAREREAREFYSDLARITKRHEMVSVFEQLAQEEEEHAHKIEFMRGIDFVENGPVPVSADNPLEKMLSRMRNQSRKIRDLSRANFSQALEYAIGLEEASQLLYSALGERSGNERVAEILISLAAQELGHKARLELELRRYQDLNR